MPWTGHQLADPVVLDRAIDALEKHTPIDAEQRAPCRRRVAQTLATQEAQLDKLIASHQDDAARVLLDKIDTRFGGLAAPQSLRWIDTLPAHP